MANAREDDSGDLSLDEPRERKIGHMSLDGMPSMDTIWGWHKELASMGTRYTGSPGHACFIEWLKDKFSDVPGFERRSDRFTFQRWLTEPKDCSLSISNPAVGPPGPVPISYYYPYSGTTKGPGSITARLIDLDEYDPIRYTPTFWAPATGAIALVRVPRSVTTLDFGQLPTGGFVPRQARPDSEDAVLEYLKDSKLVTNPIFNSLFAAVPLLDARKAGVLGVICVWTGMSDDLVANQYNPITTGYPNAEGVPHPDDYGCPALWVGDQTGQRLAECAKAGQPNVTLTLNASITRNAATETFWGVLPGSGTDHERGLIVNTHTDGPSVPEENGALALLALAQYFSQKKHRRRDLYFVMVTGHFQILQFMEEIPNSRFVAGNDAISRWMNDHPEIYLKAVAGISLEHLGCQRWADKDDGQYAWTGDFEWGATYTTQRQGSLDPTNQEAYLKAVWATNKSGAIARPVATMLPMPLFFGEGAPLYAGGLGTVSLCPIPSYLLQAGSRTHPEKLNLDKLDKALIYGQILSFARTIETLDAQPTSDF